MRLLNGPAALVLTSASLFPVMCKNMPVMLMWPLLRIRTRNEWTSFTLTAPAVAGGTAATSTMDKSTAVLPNTISALTGMLHEERPDPIGKIEIQRRIVRAIGILVDDIVKKSEDHLVPIDVAGLWSLRA